MSNTVTCLSSMATRQVLAELGAAFLERHGIAVTTESVGGVDAAKRVQAGEHFSLVVLASDAIDRLIGGGHLQAGSRVDLVRSPVAVAVRQGAPRPDLGSEESLKQAVRAARSIGFSTGPSGTFLMQLFERWGIAAELQGRVVQAKPGVPVASMVASGEVELGFQQLSELLNVEGVDVVGTLPEGAAFITTFSAGLCPGAADAGVVPWLAFLNSAAAAEIKQRHGMQPA